MILDDDSVRLTDMEARQRADEALRESERRYQRVIENALDGIMIDDVEGRIVYANDRFLTTFGLTRHDLASVKLEDYIAPEYRTILRERHERRLAGEDVPAHFEYEGLRRDGTRIWLEVRVALVEENGVVTGTQSAIRDMTDRKVADLELRASKNQLQRLVDASPAVIYSCKAFGDFCATFVSDNIRRQLGYEPSDFVGDSTFWANRIHPDDRQRVLADLQRVGEHEVQVHEYRFRHKDGSWRWMLDEWRLLRDDDGQPSEIVGDWVDITDRKAAEDSLQKQEQLHRSIINASSNFIFSFDLEGRLLSANRTLCQAAGMSEEAMLGRTHVENGFAPELEEDWRERRRQIAKTGKESRSVATIDLPDGPHTLETVLSPLLDDSGRVAAISATSVDITERLRAKASLLRLSSAVEQASDIVLMTDPNGTITYVNPAFSRCYGFSSDEAIGNSAQILDDRRERDDSDEELWRPILQLPRAPSEQVKRDKQGRIVIVNESVSPVMNSDGTIGGFIAVQTDISEAKRTEYQQTLLRERMAEFAKMEALGTLAGGLAHDFNNVLGIVLSFCSMAHKNRDNHERFEDAIRTIELAVERGAGLSRQILTFARKHLPKLVHVDVNDLVLEVAGMLRPTFPKTISWSVTVAPDLPHIVADASQLHEVLVNLCVNARDAMPAGGTITLETSLAPESAPENGFPDALRSELVMIRVSDTGAGMSDEIKARAFDPFFTTKESGTGLGLAVAYGVITTLGGRIRLDSQLGRGTSFELLLPVSERRVERVEKLREVTGLGGTETVLMV